MVAQGSMTNNSVYNKEKEKIFYKFKTHVPSSKKCTLCNHVDFEKNNTYGLKNLFLFFFTMFKKYLNSITPKMGWKVNI